MRCLSWLLCLSNEVNIVDNKWNTRKSEMYLAIEKKLIESSFMQQRLGDDIKNMCHREKCFHTN